MVVTLGQTATLSFTLGVGVVSETISVVGEAGQIDVKGSSTSASITSEDIALLPKGRDFTSIATQAAGVNQEGFAGGLSIDGASGSENRFVMTGVDTTDGFDGTSGQNLVTDFVEEVQIKSAGYAAEYGGSVGGVINAVTKTGTNEFKGWVGLYYGDRSWDGAERQSPYNTGTSLYRTYKKDDITQTEPGFGVGGPILKDKMWFYGGYTYTEREINRTPPDRLQDSDGQARVLPLQYQGERRLTPPLQAVWQLGARNIDNILPARDGTTAATVDLNVDEEAPHRELLGLRRLDPE